MRAKLLRQLGRNSDALTWYRITSKNEYGGLVYVAVCHWRAAEILDRIGRQGEGLRHYERVVSLWHDADPEFHPYVANARSRVAEIRAQGRR